MGSKQTSQSNSASTYAPPPQVLANYEQVTGQAQNIAATPYTPYSGPLVAGINGQQSAGIGAVNSASGLENPYNAGSGGLAAASAANINPTQFSSSQLQQYENPYQNDVVNATEAEIANQNAQQSAALTGNAVSSGAFGGDRAGVAQAALAGQQAIANNATLAGLNTANFQNAEGEFNTQQQTGLGAAQNTAARQLAASQQLGNLGNTAQTEALNEANAQTNAGTLQQTTQQAADTAAYNQFLQQQAYPFQTEGWLANIVEGIGSQSGGTTTGQQTTEGNLGSSIVGGLLGLGGLFAPKSRGGLVSGLPRKAGGGGLVPYLDAEQGIGGGSWVPTPGLAVGHTMPSGSGMNGGSAQGLSPTQQGQQITQIAKGVGGLGSAFDNSSLGDSFNDAMQDLGDSYASGGLVSRRRFANGGWATGGLLGGGGFGGGKNPFNFGGSKGGGLGLFADGGAVRRGYDDGGGVTPDDLWNSADPQGTGTLIDPSGGLVSPQTVPSAASGLAAQYANQMPAPRQPDSTPDAGLASLRTAMGGADVASAASAPPSAYGDIDAYGSAVPLPPPRPAGLALGDPSTAGGLVPNTPTAAEVASDNAAGTANMGNIAAAEFDPGRAATAIKGIESGGGDYKAIGPETDTGDHAYGAYQVMGANIPSWTKQYYGTALTPDQFLANKDAQDAVFRGQFGSYVRQYGDPISAASAWFTGKPFSAATAGLKDSLGTSDNDYVQKFADAYVGGTPSSAASSAIASRSAPPAGLINPREGDSGGLASGAAALSATPPAASSDDAKAPGGPFGLNVSFLPRLDDNTRQAVIAAGLGMMGGTSKSGLVNVGQGGLQGLAAYNNARNLQSEIGLRTAQTQSAQLENQLRRGKVQAMLDALDAHAAAGTHKADAVAAATSGATDLTKRTITAATIAPDPAYAGAEDPATLRDRASRLDIAGLKGGDGLRQAAQDIETMKKPIHLSNGQMGYYPASVAAQTDLEARKKSATAELVDPLTGAKYFPNPNAPTTGASSGAPSGPPPGRTAFSIDPQTARVSTAIPVAPPGGGYIQPNLPPGARLTELPETTKQQMAMDGEFQKDQVSTMRATPTVIARTQAIAQAFKTFQSGSLTDKQHDAAALASALGFSSIAQGIMKGSISGPEWVDKEGVQSVLDTLKSATPRFAQSEFNAVASHGTPNTTNQPEANHEMVSEMLALGQRNNAFLKDWEAAKQQGWSSPSAFYLAWDQANPLNGFIKSAQRQIGNFAGMDLPPAEDWAAGSVYVAPAHMTPKTATTLAKYGVKPGTMFRYNGPGNAQPIAPVAKANYFSAQLGQ